ncbi:MULTISPECIES: NAD-dependent epimerase/dehydratase family protein [Frankia]|uniref:NAD-dependent epimerase/dehydratase family protein n=1 Tax=Frankia TaxID=1854 RepID=UPI0009EC3388|nr:MULTISPECIES: NAD-dependent epimerase/dehydratase family protein [Frankia]
MTSAVLVTGAAGFIGGHLAAACHADGWEVTAVDRRAAGPLAEGAVPIIQADAADPALLIRIRSGEFAAVLHQAAVSNTLADRWDLLQDVNVDVPLQLAGACEVSATRFVYASSSSVYGSVFRRVPVPEQAVDDRALTSGPLNLYARSKLLLDQRMQRFTGRMSWTGLRYTNVFGPNEDHKGAMASILWQLLHATACGRRIDLFSDTLLAERDFLPVASLVDTVLHLLRSSIPSGVYNLGAGHAISFATILGWCAGLRDGGMVDLRLVPNPIPDRYQYWTCADMTALRGVLPRAAEVTSDQIRDAAGELYRSFVPGSASDENPNRSGKLPRGTAPRLPGDNCHAQPPCPRPGPESTAPVAVGTVDVAAKDG